MIVTSFSDVGFQQYGKLFIETFLENWPEEEKLVVYVEDSTPNLKNDRVEFRLLFEVDGVKDFLDTVLNSHPVYRGLRAEGKAYDYRMDAFKFARKVFAITDAATDCAEPMAWIDADVYTHSKVPEGFLKTVLDGKYVAFLGRDFMYTEAGFVAFNPDFEASHLSFMSAYKSMYTTGAFRYLGEWHDCYVFDMIRELHGVSGNNLSEDLKLDNPFPETVLGKYMTHLKGERKDPSKNKDHPFNKQKTA